MNIDYQVSDHGSGRFSVQLFDRETRQLLDDSDIVREPDGWKVVTGSPMDITIHDTPKAAAKWHAFHFLKRER